MILLLLSVIALMTMQAIEAGVYFCLYVVILTISLFYTVIEHNKNQTQSHLTENIGF